LKIESFIEKFESVFPEHRRNKPSGLLDRIKLFRAFHDPCPDIEGMASLRKLQLLNLAVSLLPPNGDECYLEVGTYRGKSLIAAMFGNHNRTAIACDNFSEFTTSPTESVSILQNNIAKYKLSENVRFYNEDFKNLFEKWPTYNLPPVGVYFYDGAHDDLNQYEAIHAVESILANEALVIIDDWRHAEDSRSYAEVATRRAIAESPYTWHIQWELPARHNGDQAMWWNGVAVLLFSRKLTT
jgi:predicted O-methyltransferase YrrM